MTAIIDPTGQTAEIDIFHRGVRVGAFKIDRNDLEKVRGYNWYLGFNSKKRKDGTIGYRRYYVYTRIANQTVRLHRLIMDVTDPSLDVDHINDDFWDNRKSNLQVMDHVTHAKKSCERKKALRRNQNAVFHVG